MKYPEPADKTTIAILHPRTREPERVFRRDDAASIESGYDKDDHGWLTGLSWYEVIEFPEAPIAWNELEEMADGGSIAVAGVAAPGPRSRWRSGSAVRGVLFDPVARSTRMVQPGGWY